jgi:hypothetical protein
MTTVERVGTRWVQKSGNKGGAEETPGVRPNAQGRMANSIATCTVIDPPSLHASAAGSRVTLVLSIVTAKLNFPKWVNCNDYRCRVAVALVEHVSFVDINTLVLFHDALVTASRIRFFKLRLCRVHGRVRGRDSPEPRPRTLRSSRRWYALSDRTL